MSRRGWLTGCIAIAVLALTGCTESGLGAPANLGVAAADRIEVRQVVPVPTDEVDVDEADRLPTGFGEYAFVVANITEATEVAELAETLDGARFVDTCGVVYDLSNPEYEVVFFAGDTELARLGYFLEVNEWGECRVPGRWMDENWSLLASTVSLPSGVVPE